MDRFGNKIRAREISRSFPVCDTLAVSINVIWHQNKARHLDRLTIWPLLQWLPTCHPKYFYEHVNSAKTCEPLNRTNPQFSDFEFNDDASISGFPSPCPKIELCGRSPRPFSNTSGDMVQICNIYWAAATKTLQLLLRNIRFQHYAEHFKIRGRPSTKPGGELGGSPQLCYPPQKVC